jgi:tetratricopeptide (TPR) repeat protein
MIALHPRESLHHGQLAELYVRAGAGEAARREARKAVELGPGEVAPLVMLGWVLGHDRLGRQYVYDWDRAGAIAALQKARAIDPRYLGAVVELARVLERGASGALFEPDADLRGAAEAWRAALALDHDAGRALELARLLIWSDDAAQAEKVARGAAVSEDRDRWIVTAVADARGAKEAIRVAGELRSGDERERLIGWAVLMMELRRHYDAARALYAELAVSHPMPLTWTTMLEHLARHPDPPRAVRDPRSAVTDLLLAIADPRRKSPVFWDAELEGALRNTIGRIPPTMPRGFTRTDMVADALTSSTVRIEGDAGLWRAHIEFPGKPLWIYLVLDRGTIKVVGTSELYAYAARHVLNAPLADARAIAQARQLLDWVRHELDAETAGNAVAFRRIWGAGYPSSPEAIRVAAAVLGGWLDPDRAIPVAKACHSTLPDAPRACRRTLVDAYSRTQRWADAVVELDAMRAASLEEVMEWLGSYGHALIQGGRFDDADRLVDEVLAKHPDDAGALFLRYRIALERGQMEQAAKRADAITHRPQVAASELNDLAWFELGVGSDLAGALDLARRAVQGAKSSYPAHNTLAAIEAELGDLGRAELDNRMAMDLSSSGEPTASDWYVAARIDEQLGLVDDAIAIYRRIGKPDSDPFSTAAYAYRRLAALRRAP